MALSSSRLHRIALALLERGVDPAGRFLTPLLEPEDLYAQLARQKLHRLVTQKPQNDLTLARHRPSLAKSQRACRPKPGLGKTWTSQARPHLPQAHQQQLSSQNYRSCSGPPWTLRLSQFCVQGNRVRLSGRDLASGQKLWRPSSAHQSILSDNAFSGHGSRGGESQADHRCRGRSAIWSDGCRRRIHT